MKNKTASQGVRHRNRVTITIPADMLQQAKEAAAASGQSVSEFIRAALIEHLQD